MELSPTLAFRLLTEGRLKQVRIVSIMADRPMATSVGGTVKVGVKYGLTRHKTNSAKATAKIFLDVKGIPTDAKSPKDIAFHVGIEVRGVYEWQHELEVAELGDLETNKVLCQPLFVYASNRATQAVAELGIGGVKLHWDFRTVADEVTTIDSEHDAKAGVDQVANKPPTPTRRKPRKSNISND